MLFAHASEPPGSGNGTLTPPIIPNNSVWALLKALAVINCNSVFYIGFTQRKWHAHG